MSTQTLVVMTMMLILPDAFYNQMKKSQRLAEFYKSDIVETVGIETFTDFLNFADVNFKLTALKITTILHGKKPPSIETQ